MALDRRTSAAVMAGGACGALARTVVDGAAAALAPGFPAGILLINILGAFFMGVLAGRASSGRVPARVSAFLGTGFLGGFTTFSTFALDTVTLAEQGLLPAAANVLLTVVPGVCAAAAGWRLASRPLRKTGADTDDAAHAGSSPSAHVRTGQVHGEAAGRGPHGA